MRTLSTLLILATLSASPAGFAETTPVRMDVTASVVPNCRLTVSALSFGIYDPLASHAEAPADATTTMVVSCTRETGAAVSFDFGTNSGSASDRMLAGPGAGMLQYQIFRDSARSQVWGRGPQSVTFVSRGINHPQQLTVFGRIPPRQEVAPGAYADVLTATVDF